MFRHSISAASLAAACIVLSPLGALADDQPFLTLYTTDIQTEGGREFEQWLTWKSGHPRVSANAFESRSELEYGITDDIQGSLYLNYAWEREREHFPLGPAHSADFVGVSGELIWRLMNPYFDPFGLAVYVEPSISAKEREFETKILLQKNFFNDTLRTALNINFEDVWEKEDGHWGKSSALEFNMGAAYNVTPDFSVGLEFDNENAFDGLIIGSGAREQTNAFFLGPTVQYIGHPWSLTIGAQAQLPWGGNPGGEPGAVVGGRVADAENFRLMAKFATDF